MTSHKKNESSMISMVKSASAWSWSALITWQAQAGDKQLTCGGTNQYASHNFNQFPLATKEKRQKRGFLVHTLPRSFSQQLDGAAFQSPTASDHSRPGLRRKEAAPSRVTLVSRRHPRTHCRGCRVKLEVKRDN